MKIFGIQLPSVDLAGAAVGGAVKRRALEAAFKALDQDKDVAKFLDALTPDWRSLIVNYFFSRVKVSPAAAALTGLDQIERTIDLGDTNSDGTVTDAERAALERTAAQLGKGKKP